MKFRALRTLYGDYGQKAAGEVFEVPDYIAKEMEPLEAAGVIERFRPRIDRKAFTVYENKMVTPEANKAIEPKPVAPPVKLRQSEPSKTK